MKKLHELLTKAQMKNVINTSVDGDKLKISMSFVPNTTPDSRIFYSENNVDAIFALQSALARPIIIICQPDDVVAEIEKAVIEIEQAIVPASQTLKEQVNAFNETLRCATSKTPPNAKKQQSKTEEEAMPFKPTSEDATKPVSAVGQTFDLYDDSDEEEFGL